MEGNYTFVPALALKWLHFQHGDARLRSSMQWCQFLLKVSFLSNW